jgi:hypothetical protein
MVILSNIAVAKSKSMPPPEPRKTADRAFLSRFQLCRRELELHTVVDLARWMAEIVPT